MRVHDDFVAVKVPATSANLGPGFDCMGLALDLWDEVSIHATTGATSVVAEGEGAGNVDLGEDNLVVRALRLALDHAGAPQVGVRMRCMNRIPHSRGLGSSASAIVAGLTLARALIGDPDVLGRQEILEIGSELEGHPDNVAPAVYGGATVAWMNEDTKEVGALRLNPPTSSCVLPPPALRCLRTCLTRMRASTSPARARSLRSCPVMRRPAGERICTRCSWKRRATASTRSSAAVPWNPRWPSSTGCAVRGTPPWSRVPDPPSSRWNPLVRRSAAMPRTPGGVSSPSRSPLPACRSHVDL